MRWFVEVNSIGKTEKQSYCVPADTWQRALQAARTLRADNGPMTGFSIELLDEGFSAVDPMSRLRYFVKRAPEDAALTEADTTAAPTTERGVDMGTPTAPVATAAPAPNVDAKKTMNGPFGAPVPAPDTTRSVPNPSSVPGALVPATVAASSGTPAPFSGSPPSSGPATKPSGPPARPSSPPSSSRMPASPPPPSRPRGSNVPSARPPPVQPRSVPVPAAGPSPARPRASSPPTMVEGLELIFTREQEPDGQAPLSYREYVYRVAPGTEPQRAKELLLAQLEVVKAALASARPGRLVNLAIFDVVFTGRPPLPPLVTLMWKDWRGNPTVDFPRTVKTVNGPAALQAPAFPSKPPAAPTATEVFTEPVARASTAPTPPVARTTSPPPAPAPSASQRPRQDSADTILLVTPAVHGQPRSPPPPAPASPSDTLASAVAREVALPLTVAVVGTQAAAPATPAPLAPPAPVLPPPPTSAAPPAPSPQARTPDAARAAEPPGPMVAPEAPPARRGRTDPSINGGLVPRMRGDELITDLFEVMHDLHFLKDTVDGADFCLTLALEKMPSRAGLVHLYDIDHRQFVVTCARGTGSALLLLHRYPESDPLLRAAMRKQRATVIADARTGDAASAERYGALGGAKSVVVAPVMLAGRFLGAIELIDPLDGAPFTDNEGHALTYIGEQFGEFVAARGVVLDPDRLVPNPSVTR